MPNPTISERPSLTPVFGGYTSKWNAGGGDLPIQYKIANTKFPTNSEDDLEVFTAVTDDNGYAKLDMSTANVMVANDYVKVTGSVYNGVFKVKSKDTNDLTIDAPYSATDSGTAIRYLRNYRTVVNVYAGINADHPFFYDDPIELIGTIEQKPDANNITSVDIHKYVKRKLTSTNNVGNETLPNDINGWCDFYIEYKELYDVAGAESGSGFIDDGSSFIGHAVNGALQFQNNYAGNYYAYVATQDQDDQAEWLTFFDNCFYIEGRYWDASIIHDTGEFILQMIQYDNNNETIDSIETTYTGQGRGLYRIRADQFTLLSNATRFTLQIFGTGGTGVPTTECYSVDDMTFNQEVDLRTITDGTNIDSGQLINDFSIVESGGVEYLFFVGRVNSPLSYNVHKIQLGTDGTLTGAAWLQKVDVIAQINTNTTGLLISPSGDKMAVMDADEIHVWDFNTAYDLGDITFDASYTLRAGVSGDGITWNYDGSQIITIASDRFIAFDLATNYDPTSPTDNTNQSAVFGISSRRLPISSSDGLRLFHLGSSGAGTEIIQYDLTDPDDMATATQTAFDLNVNPTLGTDTINAQAFNSDGSKILFGNVSSQAAREYDLLNCVYTLPDNISQSRPLSIDIGEPCKLNFGGAGGDLPGTGLPPDAPTLYSLGYDSDAETVSVIWLDNSADEIGFRLYRSSTGATAGYSLIAELPADQSSYLDTGIAPTDPGITYYYKVVAFNDQGFSDFSNVLSVEASIPFPVDFAGAYTVFGFRVMVEGYSGAVLRGRRTSDSVEQDFTATEVVDGTLTTFSSGSNVAIAVLYDQTGNGNDMTQATTSQQSYIVVSGVLQADGNGVPRTVVGAGNFCNINISTGSLSGTGITLLVAKAHNTGSSNQVATCDPFVNPYWAIGNPGGAITQFGISATGSSVSFGVTINNLELSVIWIESTNGAAANTLHMTNTTQGSVSGTENTVSPNANANPIKVYFNYNTSSNVPFYGGVIWDNPSQAANRVEYMQGINDIYELGFTVS